MTCSPWGATSPARRSASSSRSRSRAPRPKARRSFRWPVALDTEARQGQSVGLFQSALIAAGGNRSTEPHAFSASNLVRDAVKISLGSLEAASLPALPEPRQSAELVVSGSGRKSTVYLLGGIGPDGDVSRTLGDAFRFEAGSSQWTKLKGVIPDSRGMFRAALTKARSGSLAETSGTGDMSHPGSMPTEVLALGPRGRKGGLRATGKQLPHPRRSFAGAVLGKKYYLVGGLGADMKIVAPVDVFDFESGQWSSIAAPSRDSLASWRSWAANSTWPAALWRPTPGTSSRLDRWRSTTRRRTRGRRSSIRCPFLPADLKVQVCPGPLLLYSLDRDELGIVPPGAGRAGPEAI